MTAQFPYRLYPLHPLFARQELEQCKIGALMQQSRCGSSEILLFVQAFEKVEETQCC